VLARLQQRLLDQKPYAGVDMVERNEVTQPRVAITMPKQWYRGYRKTNRFFFLASGAGFRDKAGC